jgi:alpha-galactosidase
MGPIIAGQSATHSFLLAYEHGSQSPDAFLEFRLNKDKRVGLHAVKGNYASSTEICPGRPFETIWLQAAIVQGDNAALAEAYRDFVLRWQTSNRESRQPYIFYNTWNYQERLHHWNKRPYLSEMTEERMLAEIDAAHSMGIDVFVIDTGWYDSTGDWRVSRSRFPDGLASVRARLESCGMKLGLWFNPTAAALSSAMRQNHEDCLMTQNAKPSDPAEVWETEASQAMCLVSRYADAFTQELIRLVREVGVTYFKWDAIGQYGCDDPGHYHGSHENTQEERRDCYAFELPKVMTRIVDNLCAACPEAIVDFDVTEGGRAVGLAFLSAGKYFLINNGPYSSNYDMPIPTDGNPNLFFYPGPARAWICRTPLTFDKWLPSVLFLSHYLPDDRYINHDWQGSGETLLTDKNLWICLASLVLGQNGIWGDLPAISDGGKAKFGEALSRYKLVRNDITSAALVKTGDVGGSPEVYEKIDRSSGRGVVSIFASAAGKYTYISQAPAATDNWHNDGVAVAYDSRRRAVITMNFASSGAKLIFFGVSN